MGYFVPRVEDPMLCLRAVLGNIGSSQYLEFNINNNPHQPITKAMFEEMLNAGLQGIGVTIGDTLGEDRYSLNLPLDHVLADFHPYIEYGTNDEYGKLFTTGDDFWFRFVDQSTPLPRDLTLYLPIPSNLSYHDTYEVFYYDRKAEKLVKIADAENYSGRLTIALDETPSSATDFIYFVKPTGSYVEETINTEKTADEPEPIETTNTAISPTVIVIIIISSVIATTGCTTAGVMIWKKLHQGRQGIDKIKAANQTDTKKSPSKP